MNERGHIDDNQEHNHHNETGDSYIKGDQEDNENDSDESWCKLLYHLFYYYCVELN